MMYPYMILMDQTEITHSHVLDEDGKKVVEVHFERPTDNGFDTARCSLPSYEWIKKEGYSDTEIILFEQFLRNNVHLLFKYAETGGVRIA